MFNLVKQKTGACLQNVSTNLERHTTMTKITFKGTGQLNGPVQINKTIEVDEVQAKSFTGPNKDEAILATLAVHYPAVKINPRQIGLVINSSTISPQTESKKELRSSEKSEGKPSSKILAGVWTSMNDDSDEENDVAIGDSLSHIINLSYTNDLEDTKKKLDFISVQMTGHKWDFKNSEIVKENNRTLNQCLKQYKIGFQKLQSQTTDNTIVEHYKKELAKLNRKKILYLYWPYMLFLLVIIVLGIVTKFH